MTFEDFMTQNEKRIGTLPQVLSFALSIDDHYDRLSFLQAVQDGSVANDPDWKDYQTFLTEDLKWAQNE